MPSELALGITKDPRDVTTDVIRAKGLISVLNNGMLLDETLSREQIIAVNMMRGLDTVLKMRIRA